MSNIIEFPVYVECVECGKSFVPDFTSIVIGKQGYCPECIKALNGDTE